MNILDLLRGSRFKINTPNGNKPSTYEDSAIRARNVKFPPNISQGAGFDDYIRYEETGAVAGSPAPVFVTEYLTTEASDILMTEDNNNLVVADGIV